MLPGAKPQALLPVTSQGSVGCSPPPHPPFRSLQKQPVPWLRAR